MKLISEKPIKTSLSVAALLFSGVVHSECLPDQRLPLGSTLEWFEQTYLVSELVPPEVDSRYSEREMPAEMICPEEPIMVESGVHLRFINRRLAHVTFERIGRAPAWADWIVVHYGGESEREIRSKENSRPHDHFLLARGGQVIRYFRMPLDGGDLLERVEFEGQNLMQDRWQQLLDEEAMGR